MALYWTLLYFLESRILVQDTGRFDAYITTHPTNLGQTKSSDQRRKNKRGYRDKSTEHCR